MSDKRRGLFVDVELTLVVAVSGHEFAARITMRTIACNLVICYGNFGGNEETRAEQKLRRATWSEFIGPRSLWVIRWKVVTRGSVVVAADEAVK